MAGGSKSQACNRCGCKVPAFFKVLDESSASKQDGSWLQIPPRFIQRYAARLTGNAKIEGPDGDVWNVVVKGESITTIGLRKGWKTFVTAYGLKAGDLVVIRLVADSLFRAEIFGAKTAVRKRPEDEPDLEQPPAPLTRAQERLRKNAAAAEGIARAIVNVRKTTENVQTVPAESNVKRSRGRPRKYPAPSPSPAPAPAPAPAANALVTQPTKKTGSTTGEKRKATALEKTTASGEKTYQSVIFVSQRRAVTEAERGSALELAQRFTSKNPFLVVVMKESHVYRGFWMGIRSEFAREFLPEAITEMILRDSTGKEWPARWLGRRKNCGISGGWRKFALDHSLEEGDVCIFELVDGHVDRLLLHVHIHRVVELENELVGECKHFKVVPNKEETDGVPTQPKKKRKLDICSERLEVQADYEPNKQLVVNPEPIAERDPDLSVGCCTRNRQAVVAQALEEPGCLTPTMTLPSMDEAAMSSYKVGRLISRRKNKGVQECLVELEGTEGVRKLKSLENGGNGRWWVPFQSLEVEGGFEVCKV